MRLRFTNADHTSIEAVLDEGESLGVVAGPGTFLVPTDPLNTDYAKIVADGIEPDPYVPPEPPKEE